MPKNYNMYINRFHPGGVQTSTTLTFTWDGQTPITAHAILTAVFKNTDIPLRDGIPAECMISGSSKERTNLDNWTFLIDWFHSPIPEFLNVWIQDITEDINADMQRRQLLINLERVNQRMKEVQNEKGSLEFQREQLIKQIAGDKPVQEQVPHPRPTVDPAITNKQRIGVVGESGGGC